MSLDLPGDVVVDAASESYRRAKLPVMSGMQTLSRFSTLAVARAWWNGAGAVPGSYTLAEAGFQTGGVYVLDTADAGHRVLYEFREADHAGHRFASDEEIINAVFQGNAQS
eukprot:GFYU01041190.1.p3 GENE.GFYU01041190.1~~GFYU01041190.1.p3  ORF type:complete len:111 (+),score=21.68 GFYU01041190.1:182-514(+)